MSFIDDLVAQAKEAPVPFQDVEVELAGKVVALKFYRSDGKVWTGITAKCPARIHSPIDRQYGYDYQLAARAAAVVDGRVMDGEKELKRTPEQWDALFDVLAGGDLEKIHSAVWQLNAYDPQVRLVEAKKASADESSKKPA